MCPAEGDYEELIFCCVKKNQAFCCSEDEKLSYFTNVKYVCGVILISIIKFFVLQLQYDWGHLSRADLVTSRGGTWIILFST